MVSENDTKIEILYQQEVKLVAVQRPERSHVTSMK